MNAYVCIAISFATKLRFVSLGTSATVGYSIPSSRTPIDSIFSKGLRTFTRSLFNFYSYLSIKLCSILEILMFGALKVIFAFPGSCFMSCPDSCDFLLNIRLIALFSELVGCKCFFFWTVGCLYLGYLAYSAASFSILILWIVEKSEANKFSTPVLAWRSFLAAIFLRSGESSSRLLLKPLLLFGLMKKPVEYLESLGEKNLVLP